MIATEAGAEGINLQFCSLVVNYDLPWNPQRIEQRIGRCHRYGQTRDVTVISFLAKDNEAQRLTFEILSKKLDLFGTVLDASDEVLHQPDTDAPETVAIALGADFESSLRRIYERARTQQEIEQELRALRDEIGARRERFEGEQKRMVGIIQTELHESVQGKIRRLRSIRDTLPAGLAEVDGDLERLVTSHLDACDVGYCVEVQGDHRVLRVEPSDALPEDLKEGFSVLLGAAVRDDVIEPLHPAHSLVQAAVDRARAETGGRLFVRLRHDGSAALAKGSRGRLVVEKVRYGGFEVVESLVAVAVFGGVQLVGAEAMALIDRPIVGFAHEHEHEHEHEIEIEDALEEAIFDDQEQVARGEQPRLEQALVQLERFMEDRALVLRRRRKEVSEALLKAEDARLSALGAEARGKAQRQMEKLDLGASEIDRELERLAARDDDEYRRWSQRASERRYCEPERQRVLDL
ncbi:MAG: helicase-related protein, partial [Coriobacteriia bacterium]|nr:helicase-related protein [Coriobacteriia bacterium]